jgi:hypothetical protein
MTPTTNHATRRPLPLRRKLLFAGALASALLGLQELLVRLAFPLPEVEGFSRGRYLPLGPAAGSANRVVRQGFENTILRLGSEPDGFAFEHRLNRHGFRGPDFRLAPDPGRPRVAFVGDSFVEGLGADGGDTVTARFEAEVLGRTGRPVEAVNLGICGIGPPDDLAIARDALELLGPRAVYLVFYANDLPVSGDRALGRTVSAPFTFPDARTPRLALVLDRLWSGNPMVPGFMRGPRDAYEPVPSPNNPLTDHPPPAGADPAIVDAARRGRANPSLLGSPARVDRALRHDFASGGGARPVLERAAELSRRAGARLVVVYVPYLSIANPAYVASQSRLGPDGPGRAAPIESPEYLRQQRHLAEVTRDLDLPFLDMTGPFIRAERAGDRLYWPIDAHCNAAGYRLIAETCARHWVDGAVPPPVSDADYRSRPADSGSSGPSRSSANPSSRRTKFAWPWASPPLNSSGSSMRPMSPRHARPTTALGG